MSIPNASSVNHSVSGSSGSEEDLDKLVFSLKQGLSISDVQNDGSMFELDREKDMEDFCHQARDDYFEQNCLFDDLMYGEDDADSEADDTNDERGPFEKIRAKMEPLTPDKGVMKRIKRRGYGGIPPAKSQVTIHYNAYLEFLDEPFDSTRLRNRAWDFILEDGQVLRGLNIGVASMRQNEIAEIMITPEYGLGAMGCPPRIPANATILYVVELIKFVDYSAAIEFERMNSEDRKMANFAKVLEVCKAKNRKGNELFNTKQYHRALKYYNSAVNALSEVNMANEEEEQQQQSLLTKLYSNLSQCHLSRNAPDRAIPCALSALKCDPENAKALFRCGKASRLNGDFKMARKYLEKVARKQPSNKEIFQELQLLEDNIKKYSNLERDFCSKIFSGGVRPPAVNPRTAKLVISDEFLMSIQKNLMEFKESNIEFLPFTAGFSDADIEAVKKIASDLGLHCVVPQFGDAKLRVYRNKPE